MTGYQS